MRRFALSTAYGLAVVAVFFGGHVVRGVLAAHGIYLIRLHL